jgi:hypothetical protein
MHLGSGAMIGTWANHFALVINSSLWAQNWNLCCRLHFGQKALHLGLALAVN